MRAVTQTSGFRRFWRAGLAAGVVLAGAGAVLAVQFNASAATTPGPFAQRQIRTINGPAGDPCMRSGGGNQPLFLSACADSAKQSWRVTPVADPGGFGRSTVTMKSIDDGRCVEAEQASLDLFNERASVTFDIQMAICDNEANQIWSLVLTSTDTKFIVAGVPASQAGSYLLHAVGSDDELGFITGKVDRVGDPLRTQGVARSVSGVTFDGPGLQCAIAGLGTTPVFTGFTGDLQNYRCA